MNILKVISVLTLVALFSCKQAPAPPDERYELSEPSEDKMVEEIVPPEAKRVNVAPSREDETFNVAYLMGKFDPAKHPAFVKMAPPFADNNERYLRKDAYEAFQQMHAAAAKDGVKLTIISATRNFEAQKGIWEAKWTGARLVDDQDISKTIADPRQRALKILEYSSMPGSSRHHWGTDIDLNDLNDAHFQSGEGKKVYQWLRAHAHEYGFCQPYSPKGLDRPDGYNEEKWHWSYMPVSKKLTALASQKLKDEMIDGFKGAETAKSIGIVEKYVLGINQECL
ncbi:MAG: M15 family metallopeptidase [Saprospiraceae bacterium]